MGGHNCVSETLVDGKHIPILPTEISISPILVELRFVEYGSDRLSPTFRPTEMDSTGSIIVASGTVVAIALRLSILSNDGFQSLLALYPATWSYPGHCSVHLNLWYLYKLYDTYL